MIRILFVDDEPRVLDGLRRALHKQKHWQIYTADGGAAAIEKLACTELDVLVSDMRMPEVSGLQVLQYAATHHPHIIRIILSGHSEEEAVVSSILSTHQFFSKPCDIDELVDTVNRAYAVRVLLANESLQTIVSSIECLPSLPSTYSKLEAALNDELCTSENIATIVGQDPAIVARLLQLTNSSFFGVKREVRDVETAVQILGVDTIRAISLATEAFNRFCDENTCLTDLAELWKNIARTLDTAKLLIDENVSTRFRNLIFTGLVLQDIGRLILCSQFPEVNDRISSLSKRLGVPRYLVEREQLGTSHAELGAYLLGVWGLPSKLVEIVAFHHEPWRCTEDSRDPVTMIFLINLLDSIAQNECSLDGMPADCLSFIEKLKLQKQIDSYLPQLTV